MSEYDHTDPERSTGDGHDTRIGTILRQARVKRNLSEQDLARSLRLETRIIRQLEDNQFDQLAAPAFVRGYLRTLARELSLDGDTLVALFDEDGNRELPTLSDFESRAPLQITSDSNVIRYTTLALVLGMITLIALWWRAHPDSNSMLGYLTENAVSEQLPPTPPLSYSYAVVTHSDAPSFRAPDPEPAITSESESEAGPEHGPTANATDVAGDAGAEVVINCTAEAWVQIMDAQDRRLYYGLIKPGHEVRISGQQPYALTIGNAPAVQLSFAGQPIDLMRVASEGVARLTLGPTPAPDGSGQ